MALDTRQPQALRAAASLARLGPIPLPPDLVPATPAAGLFRRRSARPDLNVSEGIALARSSLPRADALARREPRLAKMAWFKVTPGVP